MAIPRKYLAPGFVATGGLLYGGSLLLPGFVTTHDTWPGWAILIMGWLGVLVANFAWFGNPLLLVALSVALFKPSVARWCATVGFLLGLTGLLFTNVPNDSGAYEKVLHFGAGYYLWLSSFICAIVAANLAEASGALTSRSTRTARKRAAG